ncbi:MAG: hypothetical protein AB7S26_21580 [Sandaracinaceae bacterium]
MGHESKTAERVVQLRFQPLWRYIDGIRNFCDFFAVATFDDAAVGARIGLVVHELVENAIRYSSRHEAAQLELYVVSLGRSIEVRVANSADAEQVGRFEKAFEHLAGDPRDVYLRAMERARSLPADQSGLGLPRVQFEGQMSLTLEQPRSGVVEVCAKGEI